MVNREAIAAFLAAEFPQCRGTVTAVGEGWGVVRRAITDVDLRPGGTVSGPVLMEVADVTLYVAILATVGLVPLAVTTDLTIHFLRKPSKDNAIVGRGELIKVGRRLVVGEVKLYSEGDDLPVACAVGSYALPPASPTP